MTFLRSLSLRRAVVAVAALVLGVAGQAKADILIDDYSLPTPAAGYAIAPDANPTTIVTDLGGGTTRTVTLTVTNPAIPGTNALTGSVGDGLFSASFNVFSSGTISIAYSFASALNFIPNVAAGGDPGSLQFLGAGDSGFAADIPVTITVATATGNLTGNTTLPLTTTFSPVDLPLAGLTGTGDLTQVNGVTLDFTAGQAADLIFDSLNVTTPDAPPPADVPAPPAALLALAALPILGLRRKLLAKKA